MVALNIFMYLCRHKLLEQDILTYKGKKFIWNMDAIDRMIDEVVTELFN